jgi:hypothetical protein
VLGVMSDGKLIRGVPLPSRVLMWVTWQWDVWKRKVEPKRGISIRAYRYMEVDRWNLSPSHLVRDYRLDARFSFALSGLESAYLVFRPHDFGYYVVL